jgi:hypothetical protein
MVAGKIKKRRFSIAGFWSAISNGRSLMSHSANHTACQRSQPANESLVRRFAAVGVVLALRHGNNRHARA